MYVETAVDYGYSERETLTVAQEQQLLLDYLPLVKRVVNQLSHQANHVMDKRDMEQIALLALLESLRRYGMPDQQFPGFAKLRVRGAVLDELRRLDWRPRQLRQQAHRIRDAVREMTARLGREPKQQEVMQYANISEEEYSEYMSAEAGEALESLDQLLEGNREQMGPHTGAFEQDQMNQRMLEQALVRLDERERLVLLLYYQQELSLKEIALVLEISDARVCQLSKQAIRKCHQYLTDGVEI